MKNFSLFFLLFFFLLFFTYTLLAIPSISKLKELEQPDGSKIKIIQYGDENYKYFENELGYSIKKDTDGFWKYEVEENGKFKITKIKANEKPLSSFKPKLRKIKREKIKEIYKEKSIKNKLKKIKNKKLPQFEKNPKNKKERNLKKYKKNNDEFIYEIKGKNSNNRYIILDPVEKVLIIRIEFTDVKGSVNYTEHYNEFFSNEAGSLRNYFYENSYGNLYIEGNIYKEKYYKSSKTMKYYGEDSDEGIDDANVPIYELVREAVRLANNDINFREYDTDNDGEVDNLIIIHSGQDQAYSANPDDIWSHCWYLPDEGELVDGVYVKNYILVSEFSPLGVIAHEFFHNLGAPDLYDIDFDGFPTALYCLMSYGAWLNDGNTPSNICAYLKMDIDANPDNGYIGWLAPFELSDSSGTFNILSLSNWSDFDNANRVYRINTQNQNEYFIITYRKKNGYDYYLPDEGILIWHIDESMPDKSKWLNAGTPLNSFYRINLISPDINDKYKFDAAFSLNDNQFIISPFTIPNTNLNNGEYSNIVIKNISAITDIMSFTFEKTYGPILLNNFNIVQTNDNDTMLEENETAVIEIYLKNYGTIKVENLNCFIYTENQGIDIIDSHFFISEINSEEIKKIGNFKFFINDNLQKSEIIFQIEIKDNFNNSWQDSFVINIIRAFNVDAVFAIDTDKINVIFNNEVDVEKVSDISNYSIKRISDSVVSEINKIEVAGDLKTITIHTLYHLLFSTDYILEIKKNVSDKFNNELKEDVLKKFESVGEEIYYLEHKSIHQIEKEYYQNYVPTLPPFQPVVPLNQAKSQPRLTSIVYGYYPFWISSPTIYWELIHTLSFFSLDADTYGNIVSKNGWPSISWLNTAHSNGVRIEITCALFGTSKISGLLSSSTYRTNLVNNLIAELQAGNADGICIDFEFVPSSQKTNFITFLTELRNALKNMNPDYTLSIAGPAVVSWYPGYDFAQIAAICDYIFIMAYDYHYSGGPPGPVAPLAPSSLWGSLPNDSATISGYLSATSNGRDTLILGVPYYGLDWPTTDYNLPGTKRSNATARVYKNAITYAQTYGRHWDASGSVPYVLYGAPSDTHQFWYDDTVSIALKYNLVKSSAIKGTGMWAIGSDGTRTELWDLLENYFGAPSPPKLHYVKNIGANRVSLKWTDPPQSDLSKLYLYQSTDGINFTIIDNNIAKGTGTKTVSGLNTGQVYYFYLTGIDTNNNESRKSEVYAVFVTNDTPQILIVHDDARYVNSAYASYYANALAANNYSFDYCDSISVTSNYILLANYNVVIWYNARDSHSSGGSGTLSNDEQSKLIQFLNTPGKRLFISGQEIGYDLDYLNYGRTFYNNYLKTSYVADDAGSPLTLDGVSGTIFSGLTFYIDPDDNGGDSGGAYDATYPDVVNATTGATVCIQYSGVGGAATYYSSLNDTKIVCFGFPFETITSATKRAEIMEKIMDFFGVTTTIEDSQPPSAPTFLSLCNTPNAGEIQIRWLNPSDNDLHHINIYRSIDGINFTLFDTATPSPAVKTISCNNNTFYYFVLSAVDNSNNESSRSDTYVIKTTSGTAAIVIVEDDNRYGKNNYAAYYGIALDTNNYAFDCVASEAIQGNTIALSNYSIVIWFTGKDSNYGYNTFNSTEQSKVQAYLDAGGKLFVSGQEIAYELDYKNYGDTFYKNYFRAQYSVDDAGNSVSVIGTSGGIFNGITFYIDGDNGVNEGGAYDATYPDGITAYNGSTLCLSYSSGYGAGINYSGTYKLISFGFPFETITTEYNRKIVIQKIMEYFGYVAQDTRPKITVSPDSYTLIQGTYLSIELTASDDKDTALNLTWSVSDTSSAMWDAVLIVEGETDYLFLQPKLTALGTDTIIISVRDSDLQSDSIIFTVNYISTLKPDTPILKYVKNNGTGTSINIAFYSDTYTYKYLVYKSTDGVNFEVSDTIYHPEISATISGLTNNTLYFFKILNVNSVGTSSDSFSDVYAVRTTNGNVDILVVEDDNRYGPHNYILNYAKSLNNLNKPFNTCSAEAVVDNYINLFDYDKVIWFCSKDSYNGYHTFNVYEQEKVMEYLDNGGNFFVSGNEIAYDLDYKGYAPIFYNTYLRADYGADDAYRYTLKSVSNTIFNGLSDFYIYTDDAGSTQGIAAYQAKWPDRFNFVSSYNGSSVCLKYWDSGWGAAVEYSGGYGVTYSGKETSIKPAKLVNFAFAFECINDTTARDNVMAKILNFFDSSSVVGRIEITGLSDLSGATVSLVKSDYSETKTYVTDNAGRFRFDFIDNGTYFLKVEKEFCLTFKTSNFNISTSSDTFISVSLIAGDVVQNNKINVFDASKIKANFGNTSPDINKDGTVDSDDLEYVRTNFKQIGN